MYVAGVQLSAWFMRLKSYFTPVLSRLEQSSTFHCQAKNCAIGQLRASFCLVLAGFEIFIHNLRNIYVSILHIYIWKIENVPYISKLAKMKPFEADYDLTMKSAALVWASGSPNYTKITNTVSTTRVFGLCTCKWGIFALVEDPAQSH